MERTALFLWQKKPKENTIRHTPSHSLFSGTPLVCVANRAAGLATVAGNAPSWPESRNEGRSKGRVRNGEGNWALAGFLMFD